MAKKRHPGSRRRPHQRDDEAEDVFVAKVFELSTWARKNSQVLILFGVALGLVIAGVLYYVSYRSRLQAMAVQELESIQQSLSAGEQTDAKARLSQYIQRFSSTPHAAEARLVLAQLDLQDGQAGEAVQVLEASDVPVTDPLGPQVAVLLARAYEAQGQPQQAEELYLRVADRARLEFQKIDALQDAARIRMEQGNPQGAAELYQRVLDQLEPNDPDRGRTEMRLAEAKTAAEG